MNQLSWRRILERAGDEGPESDGGTVVNLHEARQERPQQRGRAERAPVENVGFEAELKRALDRSQFDDRKFVAPARQPRKGPAVPAEAPAGQIRVPQQPNPRMRSPVAGKRDRPQLQPARQKPAKNGAKNLLAIMLSAVVIGFAFYQISSEWKKVNGVDSAQTPDSFAPVAATVSSGAVTREPAAEPDRGPFDLRPSLASRSEGADPAAKDQSSLLAKEEASRADRSSGGTGASAASMLEDTEQSMLKRGHEMMQQGHVSGARIVFEHLAEQKSPLGAFALAQSYDARFLRENNIIGPAADAELAAIWYQRAAELTESAVTSR